ncbi:hypothetical protein KKI17_01515 [Patescibacteria group bacterium]|nr:hypothetical protein [Patescibacteria group bacterium]
MKRRTVQITLRGIAPWISEISYEKGATDVKLYFTLATDSFSAKDVLVNSSPPTENIVARILQKLEYLPAAGLSIATLSTDELEGNIQQLPAAAGNLRERLGPQHGFLLLYQPGRQVCWQGILCGGNTKTKAILLGAFQGKEKGPWALFSLGGLDGEAARARLLGSLIP